MTPAEATPKRSISSYHLNLQYSYPRPSGGSLHGNPASSGRASRAVILSIGFRAPKPVHVYEATAESRIVRFWHFPEVFERAESSGY
jgi:hypothetical protein